MVVLLLIGFVAGVITAVSPCVLPVLPILLAGAAAGGPRRPYAIIAGLIVSFTVFTLAAVALLSALGLPQDLLRNVAIALLFLVAGSLLVPRLALILELPLARLSRRRGGDLGGGFLLGVSLALVFVPCAGPVFAAVSVLAAEHRIGVETVLLTVFYAAGTGVVLLLVAIGGQRVSRRLRANRRWFRPALGVIIAAGALAIVFNADRTLQTRLGSYTTALQRHTEGTASAQRQLHRLTGGRSTLAKPAATAVGLPDYGTAPDFQGIAAWLNTPADAPLTLARLRGKVVLVDFWTYSCINCLRTLPYIEKWDSLYRHKGLVIVGVHTPEFSFEHDLGNVRAAVKRLGVRYPVALDNDYGTWKAYGNNYWPADYLIDQSGHVRELHIGEGGYDETQGHIRLLLEAGRSGPLPPQAPQTDRTPQELRTPETYLGYLRIGNYAGSPVRTDRSAQYTFPASLAPDSFAYAGNWNVEGERILAGRDARLRLRFTARSVHLVLTGRGSVGVQLNGKAQPSVAITGDRLYTLVSQQKARSGVLDLRFTQGLSAYAFTFG